MSVASLLYAEGKFGILHDLMEDEGTYFLTGPHGQQACLSPAEAALLIARGCVQISLSNAPRVLHTAVFVAWSQIEEALRAQHQQEPTRA